MMPLIAFAVGLVFCGLSMAQQYTEVRLRLHPAGIASPALRYDLAPPMVQMREEDAEPHYAEAIALLKPLLDGPQGALFEAEVPLNAEQRERLVPLFAPVMQKLQVASRCTFCRWKHRGREEGMSAKLPYLAQMRWMEIGVCATVRQRVDKGEFEPALEGLQVGLAMARHVETNTFPIQVLVANSMDQMLLAELENFVQQPGAPNLYWAITAMPRMRLDLHGVMQWERATLEFSFPALRDPMKMTHQQWSEIRNQLIEIRKKNDANMTMGAEPNELSPGAKEALLRSGMSQQQLAEMEPWRASAIHALMEYRRMESELFKSWFLTGEEAADQVQEAMVEIRAADRSGDLGLFMQFLPNLNGVKIGIEITNRRLEALRIVEAIRDGAALPADLGELHLPLPDPAPPFTYRREGNEAILDASVPWAKGPARAFVYRLALEQ